MKATLCLLVLLLFTVSGCAGPSEASVEEPVKVQTVALSNLNLKENQSFGVSDYYENQLLLLIYDTQKRDPREDESLQAPAKYCIKFVLYDLIAQQITKEFPIEAFGHCLSAAYAYDGVFLTWVTTSDEREALSSISYIDAQGMRKIFDLSVTKFSLGPLLCRVKDGLVFSYSNELSDGVFGVSKITKELEVEPLLRFLPDETDWISDEIVTAGEHYIYPVGEQGRVTFNVGTADKVSAKFSLAEGEKIHSFSMAGNWILVSKSTAVEEGGNFVLERFDLAGNSMELYPLAQPLYWITGSQSDYFCAFIQNTAFELFEITDSTQNITPSTHVIDSTFNRALSNGEGFVIISYENPQPHIWRVDLPHAD